MNEEHNSQEALQQEIQDLKLQVADLQAQMQSSRVTSYITALNTTATKLLKRKNVDDLLQAIVDQSTELADTAHGFIYVLEDEDQQIMRARSASGLFKKYLGRTLTPDEGVVGHVVRTGESLTVVDYPNWDGRTKLNSGDAFYSAAAFPLKINEKIIGILALVYEETGREFSTEMIEILSGFAHLAAIAIDNAKLYQDLTESQHFTRKILDTIPEIVRVHDVVKGGPIFANNSLPKILGYSIEDANAMETDEQYGTIHPDDFDNWISAYNKAFEAKDNEIIEVDFRIRHKDGHWLWLRRHETVFQRDETGKPYQLLAIVYDITERKKAELALEASQQFNKKIAETIPDIIRIFDIAENRNIYGNDGITRVLGYQPEELEYVSEEDTLNFVHPQDQQEWLEANHLIKSGTIEDVHEFEYRFKHANGTWRWIHLRDTVFSRDEQNKPKQIIGIARDITEQKNAEVELQKQAHLLNVVNEAIVSCDLNNIIQSWNKGAEKLYGWRAEDVIGKQVSNVIPTGYSDDITDFIVQNTLREKAHWEGEILQFHKNGEAIHIFNSTTLIKDENDTIIGTVVVNRDISARKKIENDLKESQHFAKKVTDTIPEMLRVYDLVEQKNIYANGSLEEILGYLVDEINTLDRATAEKMIHPEDVNEWNRMLNALHGIRTNQVLEATYRVRHANGEWRWLNRRDIVFQTDGDGNPTQTLNITEDITEKKEREKQLEASEQRFRTMMDTTHAIVFLFDAKKNITYINPASEEILGYEQEALLGSQFWALLDEESSSKIQDVMTHYLETGTVKPPNLELKVSNKDDDLCWLDLTLAEIESDGQKSILGTAIDITDRKRAEERTIAFNLERQKVHMISDFITTMSHDFRTPLSTLNTSLYLLEHDPDPSSKTNRITIMQKEIGHMENLIDGLLTMTRLDSDETAVHIEKTNINEILKDIIVRVHKALQAKAQQFLFDEKPLNPIDIDSALIYKAILNIIDNAIQYTQVGGKIQLEALIQDDKLLISVKDNGMGINEEDKPYIFNRFYRGDKARSSRQVGLGLSIAQKIVELHGGEITFTSKVNEGSEFIIYLPILVE